ncbi:MAG TPA: Holliday junction resolvase RuvX [Candidatus Methanoperedens sp.]|nr:Holliday junction resolvase RuvX [Candidatus Methanoperedens sp.]
MSSARPGGRILGLDPGTKNIGVAVSDELHLAAHGLPNIAARPLAKAIEAVKSLAEQYIVDLIVVGLPMNMDGSLGPSAEAAQDFARRLEEALPGRVRLVDERLTTVQAERALLEADVSRARRKRLRDRLAAVLILQSHLDQLRAAADD